jgi:selenocysteine-specific translation elongation factor
LFQGVQTQTAECLVVGEILMNQIIVVLNKVDMLPADEREAKIDKMQKGLLKVFAGTKFKDPVMIPVSATGGTKILKRLCPLSCTHEATISDVLYLTVENLCWQAAQRVPKASASRASSSRCAPW